MVDANAAYTLDDLQIFRELDRFQLMMIEQPLAAVQSPKQANCKRISRRRCAPMNLLIH
jgi:L-alanine-DL-glutamate epimerase-like enolase superfamily enzyme